MRISEVEQNAATVFEKIFNDEGVKALPLDRQAQAVDEVACTLREGAEHDLQTVCKELRGRVKALEITHCFVCIEKGRLVVRDAKLFESELSDWIQKEGKSAKAAAPTIREAFYEQSKELDLSGCRLQTLPPSLRHFFWLESLDLSSNQLQSLSEQLALPALTHLNVSYNQLQSVPTVISCMRELLDLDLQGNALRSLKGALPSKLKGLHLSSNQFESFPESILNCNRLETLSFSDNALKTLPGTLDQLPLREMDLSRNELEALPSSLVRMAGLERLYVNQNQLETLPEGMHKMPHFASFQYSQNPGFVSKHSSFHHALDLGTPETQSGPMG